MPGSGFRRDSTRLYNLTALTLGARRLLCGAGGDTGREAPCPHPGARSEPQWGRGGSRRCEVQAGTAGPELGLPPLVRPQTWALQTGARGDRACLVGPAEPALGARTAPSGRSLPCAGIHPAAFCPHAYGAPRGLRREESGLSAPLQGAVTPDSSSGRGSLPLGAALCPARFWAAPPPGAEMSGDGVGQVCRGGRPGAEPGGTQTCPPGHADLPTDLPADRRGWSADVLLRVFGLPGKGAEARSPGPFPVDSRPHEHSPPRGERHWPQAPSLGTDTTLWHPENGGGGSVICPPSLRPSSPPGPHLSPLPCAPALPRSCLLVFCPLFPAPRSPSVPPSPCPSSPPGPHLSPLPHAPALPRSQFPACSQPHLTLPFQRP